MEKTEFIILGPARSGSTLLRNLINRHPKITCHGELFAKRILGYALNSPPTHDLLKIRSEGVDNFLDFIYSGKSTVIGFKLLYEQCFQAERVHLIDKINERRVKVIHLWRKNLASVYVSRRNLINFEKEPISISKNEFLEFIRSINSAKKHTIKAVHGLQRLDIFYEDLISNHAMVLDSIFDFLGAERIKISLPDKKISATANYVLNEDELQLYHRELSSAGE